MSSLPRTSIIIPTQATAERAALLERAIASLLDGQDGLAAPIVVANGRNYDREVIAALRRRGDIRLIYREEGSATAARLAGRRAVDTEFFGMLDDDDEYLPGAIATRAACLVSDPSLDVIITNGYRREGESEVTDLADFARFGADPLAALMDAMWLQPAGALYRSSTVPVRYFEGLPFYLEWTYLAMKLAQQCKLRFLDVPTYRMHRGTPQSLSASRSYLEFQPQAISQMLELNIPPAIKDRLQQKYASSLHQLAESARSEHDLPRAWRHHLRSLLAPRGLRYLSYTRHLLRRSA